MHSLDHARRGARSPAGFGDQPRALDDLQMVRIGHDDQPGFAQAGQGTAHRIDGQPKMVGNIGPGHRHVDPLAFFGRLALGQLEHEARNPLVRILAAQQQHLLLRRSELGRRPPEQSLLERRK